MSDSPFPPQSRESRPRTKKLMRAVASTSKKAVRRFANADETSQILLLNTWRISLVNGETPYQVTEKFLKELFGPKFTERVLQDSRYLKLLHLDGPGAHTIFTEPPGTD